MPRRTRAPRRTRRTWTPPIEEEETRPTSTEAMARDLVKRGLATPLILGPGDGSRTPARDDDEPNDGEGRKIAGPIRAGLRRRSSPSLPDQNPPR